MITNKQIVEKIKKASKIAIFAHKDPDPDSLGSSYGLREFCFAMGKTADVFIEKIKRNNLYDLFPISERKTSFSVEDYDLAFMVDLHNFSRVDEEFRESLRKHKNIIIIDHHTVFDGEELEVENFIIKPESASASQMILSLYKEAEVMPSKVAATYIYAGLMGDTNRFLNANLNEEVFDDAKKMFQCGAEIQTVYETMYKSISKENIALSAYLYKKVVYVEEGKGAYIVFTQKTMRKLGVSVNDVKEFSNALIVIQGVEVGFLVYETEKGEFKFSIRSSKNFNTLPFVSKMGGGGHINASGFEMKNINNKYIKKKMSNWIKEILNG